jgi:C4-dicarboxylate transporter DctM subunit
MIIYAIVVSGRQVVDVGDLFLAGIGPGLLIGALLAGYVIVHSLRRSETPRADVIRMLKGLAVVVAPFVVGEVAVASWAGPIGHAAGPVLLAVVAVVVAPQAFVEGFWALMLPVLILGGIYTGIFTPTEAAAVAVVYSLVAAIYIYRELTWREVPALVVESTVLMGAIIVIMVIAFVFNHVMVDAEVAEKLVAVLESLQLSKVSFLIALNLMLLVVGCFMDIISAILIVVPLIVPLAAAFQIDPIHLGIIFIVNLEIGYLTPPLGLNLFVATTLFKRPLGEVVRAVVPFTAIMFVGVLLITYVPAISLGAGAWLNAITEPAEEPGAPPPEPGDAGAGGGKVLSIEELMRGADDADDAPGDDAPAGERRVLSIEDLMKQADDAEDEGEPTAAPNDAENEGEPAAVPNDAEAPEGSPRGEGATPTPESP